MIGVIPRDRHVALHTTIQPREATVQNACASHMSLQVAIAEHRSRQTSPTWRGPYVYSYATSTAASPAHARLACRTQPPIKSTSANIDGELPANTIPCCRTIVLRVLGLTSAALSGICKVVVSCLVDAVTTLFTAIMFAASHVRRRCTSWITCPVQRPKSQSLPLYIGARAGGGAAGKSE